MMIANELTLASLSPNDRTADVQPERQYILINPRNLDTFKAHLQQVRY